MCDRCKQLRITDRDRQRSRMERERFSQREFFKRQHNENLMIKMFSEVVKLYPTDSICDNMGKTKLAVLELKEQASRL